MELYFNELSINDLDSLNYKQIQDLIAIYHSILEYNIRSCRIANEDQRRLFDLIKKSPNSSNLVNFYYSFFKAPYETELLEKEQDKYLENNWLYKEKDCFGMALAYLLHSIALSISQKEWEQECLSITKNGQEVFVRNISLSEHVAIHSDFLQEYMQVELVECLLLHTDKKITLRDDHGKDVLMEFSKKLLKSPYVCEVVNSLPYNPRKRKFIKTVRENGIIEIVLPWTDKGLGVAVKTTGRDLRETERIAEILEKEYGYI